MAATVPDLLRQTEQLKLLSTVSERIRLVCALDKERPMSC